jgi:hypothetical protein
MLSRCIIPDGPLSSIILGMNLFWDMFVTQHCDHNLKNTELIVLSVKLYDRAWSINPHTCNYLDKFNYLANLIN